MPRFSEPKPAAENLAALATTGEMTHTARLDDEWSTTITVAFDDAGSLVVSGLAVVPSGDLPPGGLTSRRLRDVSVPHLLRQALEFEDAPGLGRYLQDRSGPTLSEPKGGAPRQYDDRFLAELAVEWEHETAIGRGAYARVSARRGEPQSKIKHWVDLATDRGFLQRSTHAGGVRPRFATSAAHELLAQEVDR